MCTGCNTGIGKVTAHDLSKRGAKVIMLCRSLERAEPVAEEIRKDTGNVVVVMQMDLASLESVRSCAAKLIQEEDKIDLLVNNGGKHHSQSHYLNTNERKSLLTFVLTYCKYFLLRDIITQGI